MLGVIDDNATRNSLSSIFKFPLFFVFKFSIAENNASQMYIVENCNSIFTAFLAKYESISKT